MYIYIYIYIYTHTGTSQKIRIWWKSSFFLVTCKSEPFNHQSSLLLVHIFTHIYIYIIYISLSIYITFIYFLNWIHKMLLIIPHRYRWNCVLRNHTLNSHIYLYIPIPYIHTCIHSVKKTPCWVIVFYVESWETVLNHISVQQRK